MKWTRRGVGDYLLATVEASVAARVRLQDETWIAQAYVHGSLVHLSEHVSRDVALAQAESAVATAEQLRRFDDEPPAGLDV